MKKKKRIVLICFYDKICLSTKALSAKLKEAGHQVYLIYLKDDRGVVIDKFKKNPIQYQVLWLDQFWGCGMDISKVSEKEWQILSDLVADINPDVIGVSSRSVHKDLAGQTARKLRPIAPKAALLAGGYGPTLLAKEYLAEFDYVCIGEGDNMIVPFVEADNPKFISNIAYLENNKVAHNKILPPANLDELPFIDWIPEHNYFIEDDKVQTGHSFYDSQAYDIFCTRGCPSTCTYCMACQWTNMLKPFNTIFPKVRLRSPQSVIDELIYAKKKYNINHVRFKDDIFGLNEKWLFEFMDLYDRKIGLSFYCLFDERHTTKKIVKRLYQSGLRKSCIGIQSANEDIRRDVFNRQISDDRIVAFADMLNSFGIQSRYDMIGWDPFETHETLENGMHFLKRLPMCADTSVFQLKMFPGSPILEKFNKEKPTPLSTDEYTYWALLHQMVLYSTETRKKAFIFAKDSSHDINKVLQYFRTKIREKSKKLKVIAVIDINKGSRIMTGVVGLEETDIEGITISEIDKLTGMAAKSFIKKGTVLQWNQFYHSYAGIRARGSNNT